MSRRMWFSFPICTGHSREYEQSVAYGHSERDRVAYFEPHGERVAAPCDDDFALVSFIYRSASPPIIACQDRR